MAGASKLYVGIFLMFFLSMTSLQDASVSQKKKKKMTPGYIRIYTADTSIRKRKMADQQRQGAS
jgi:hypothetical protein